MDKIFGRMKSALAVLLGVLGVGMALQAQAPRPDKKLAGARKLIIKNAQLGSYKETPAGAVSTFTGGVVFDYDDTTLTTDAATYNHKTQVATSPGKLQIDDAQNTLVGDKGRALYKTKKAEINGNIRITARPRPQDLSAPEGSLRREFKSPVAITCDRVEYNWRTRVAIATGNLTLRQTERTVTADRAVYDGKTETVVLTGNVRGVTTAGDDLRGVKATVILREDLKPGEVALTLEGVNGGSFTVDDEDPAVQALPPAPTLSPVFPSPAPGPAAPPR